MKAQTAAVSHYESAREKPSLFDHLSEIAALLNSAARYFCSLTSGTCCNRG